MACLTTLWQEKIHYGPSPQLLASSYTDMAAYLICRKVQSVSALYNMTNYLPEGSWSLSTVLLCPITGGWIPDNHHLNRSEEDFASSFYKACNIYSQPWSLWPGPYTTTTAHPTCTLLILVRLQNRTTGMLTNSPLAFHRVKLSDIMDTPARNMKLQQKMDIFLMFTEFLLGGMTKIQVWHSYRTQGRSESQLLHGFPIFPLCTCNGMFHTFPFPQEYLVRKVTPILNPSEVHTSSVSVLISDFSNNCVISKGWGFFFPQIVWQVDWQTGFGKVLH